MAAILKNGRHLKFQVARVFFFKKVTPKGYLRQVWCLYHILKDSPGKKHLSAALYGTVLDRRKAT